MLRTNRMSDDRENIKDLNILDEYKDKIIDLDDKILSLLSRRLVLAKEVGRIKKELGIDLIDLQDDQEALKRLVSEGREDLDDNIIRNIFSEIISASRSVQQNPMVAFLGPDGTFCHEAAISYFGKSTLFSATDTIEKVFELVEKDTCYQGIVPIENSYEGSVNRTLDLFHRYNLKISGEIFIRIRLQLLSMAGHLDNIKVIYSHPMAIAQCRLWLGKIKGGPIREVESTSRAAEIASKDLNAAALASRFSGELYGLRVLEENIEDDPDNITRFLVIGKSQARPTGKDKTSIMFFLGHKPGALHKALGALADSKINMTRIESRPMKLKNWEYLFFVDLEGHMDDNNLNTAIKNMKKECVFLKNLGSYPAGS